MSFYHVLPSNAAPQTFPNNHASSFSIPLDNPYNLSGQWEVAMMNMSYTGCVNTFHHDTFTMSYKPDLKTRLLKTPAPVSWSIPPKKTLADMLLVINESLKGVLRLNMLNEHHCQWNLVASNLFVVLSRSIAEAVKLEQDVLTPWDKNVSNWFPFTSTTPMPKDASITFVPLNYNHDSIEVKAANETLTPKQLVSRFNARIANASLMEKSDSLRVSVKEHVILFTTPLRRFLAYHQSGVHVKPPSHFYAPNVYMSMKEPWTVDVYALNRIEPHTSRLHETVTLPPISFQRRQDAVTFLNTHVLPNIKFTIDKQHYLQVAIDDANVSLTLSDTLRDIFAFDKNTITGVETYRATGVFSLTRRIHYLYVYSSVTDYVRIGNTEAPLLAVIPFSVSSSCDILKEETFKNPMYIPVRHNSVSQVDIEIHDDAGALVPFVAEAVTSLRLHYRQI